MAEEAGLRQVVETYGNMVYRLALAQTHSGHDADDVFQEVFLRYLRAAPDFREEEHRKAWLLRVTVNCCKKFHTSFWRRHTTALSEAIPARTEEEGELLTLLEGLPEKYRAVLHLYYYEGYATGWAAVPTPSAASSPGGGPCCTTHGKERKSYDGRELSGAV